MASPVQKRPVGKRFVIACDGTWQNSDMGFDKSIRGVVTAQIPSNVTRIARAIKHYDGPIQQIVYYQRGIGSDGSLENKAIGGLTGDDVSEKIREAYAFLANNFDPETQKDLDDESKPRDEIILIGFSRGAFTARAIASMISDIGLLTRKGMESFWGIFTDWMGQDTKGSEWFEKTYGAKAKFTDDKYKDTLRANGLTRYGMPIKAVAVWDTVGALGIPLPWNEKNVKEYSFVNTKVARQVEYAFHALALDEHRNLFTPTLWEAPDKGSNLKLLQQTWFPGVHSNVGGSYADAGISNITLAWMISKLEDTDGGILAFSPDYLDFVQDLNNKGYAMVPEKIRPWGMGRLYDSDPENTIKGVLQGMTPITRTPGRYSRVSTVDGKQTNTSLKGTGESIHRCVRVRINGGGRRTEEDPAPDSAAEKFADGLWSAIGLGREEKYASDALKNFELVQPAGLVTETDHSGKGPSGVVWKARDGGENLPEEELGATEIRMLKKSVETARLAKN